jgi:inosine/xanthosine triphosphatase
MPAILIAVGSTRRPKLGAVEEAVASFGRQLNSAASFEVQGFEAASGVSDTPCSREELMRGARQRADALKQALEKDGRRATYYVGLEGGLDVAFENGSHRVFLESWVYVTDGTKGFFGRSGGIELPDALIEEVMEKGVDLSVAIDRFAGEVGIRDSQGAWGVLSGNLISRQEAFRVAVLAAFAPFYNAQLYKPARAAGA